ncbi:YkvA family protein [Sphingosinicella sp. BN140058]|uniref:YkvA family protein n=1 Tax=Sphingosinicella sp. BN140058 TaxID=1892855 RepID=UPI001FB0DF5F|nr:DUF1232 domain-containing protein [Sphingosinicella sp. BN140058]
MSERAGGRGHGRSLARRLRIEIIAAWRTVRDPRCPWHARIVGLIVTAYALSPIDLIPDFIPVLGLLDDVLLVPAGLWLFARLLPPGLMEEHRAALAADAEKPRSAWGIVMVFALWAGAAWLGWLWLAG